MTSLVPAPRTEGKFDAKPPFNKICKSDVNYRADAVRTPTEIRIAKLNIQHMVFDPVGIDEKEGKRIIEDLEVQGGSIVTLLSEQGNPIHVPSTYFNSIPVLDGVALEYMCIYAPLGAVVPELKNALNETMDVFKDTLKRLVGITDPEVHLGVVPTRTYVTKEQAELIETNRKKNISNDASLASQNIALKKRNEEQAAYILELQAALAEKSTEVTKK